MSWKKELLKGLVELKGEVARQQGVIVLQDQTIQRQQGTIERLLDRIQAGSYRELKMTPTSEPKFDAESIAGFYEPGADEDLVGMAVPVEDQGDGGESERGD